MHFSFRNSSLIKIIIHVFPDDEKFSCYFDKNISFGELKNDLLERKIIKKGVYYFEMGDDIMNDDMILKDNGVKYKSCINVIRNDCIKIIIDVHNTMNRSQTIKKYMFISDFKVIKADENKEVKNEEINRVIDLLKDESSDRLSILEDLNCLCDKINDGLYKIDELFLEMDFLSSVMKIFEEEKEGDENDLIVIIMRKLFYEKLKKEGNELFKTKDAFDVLCNVMKNQFYGKYKEDVVKLIIIIAKKYPSDIINNNNLKNCTHNILPSNGRYSYETEKNIYILFKEMIKEGIIKKGEEGTEIIEEILFVAEMVNKKKDIINIKEEYYNIINEFIITGKENGFESKLFNNKNEIMTEDIYVNWMELFKKDNTNNNSEKNEEEEIKEEDKEKIKKFCDYVISHSLDIQIQFINKLYYFTLSILSKTVDEKAFFNSRKNGFFLYYYFPSLFRIYHLEQYLPVFLVSLQSNHKYYPLCFEYLIKLYNEIIERMMREEKEIEVNEENIIIILFLWSIKREEGRKETEIKYLIDSTLKISEILGRIEEENKEEIKEKEKEGIIKEDKKEEGIKESVNRKEMLIFRLLESFNNSYWKSSKEDQEKIKKERRIGKVLLEIVKNHLKNERCLIKKGNKRRIIEYIIYSYNKYTNTSDLLSLSSPSFPLSHKTVVYILYLVSVYVSGCNVKELNKDMLMLTLELFNNYIDIKKTLDGCDVKKEIEGDILIEWNNNIKTDLYKKISLEWNNVKEILCCLLESFDMSLLNKDNFYIMKEIINLHFNHNNNNIYNNNKKKDNNNKDMEESIVMRSFKMEMSDRRDFIESTLPAFVGSDYYCIIDVYHLVNKSEEGCNIIDILMKELSGEIVDRIKKKEGNNIIKERRRYERERSEYLYDSVLFSLSRLMKHTFMKRNNNFFGRLRNKDSYERREKEMKEDKDYISDIIEEEDIRECLILYLKHLIIECDYDTFEYERIFSILSIYSNNTLFYLLSVNKLKEEYW